MPWCIACWRLLLLLSTWFLSFWQLQCSVITFQEETANIRLLETARKIASPEPMHHILTCCIRHAHHRKMRGVDNQPRQNAAPHRTDQGANPESHSLFLEANVRTSLTVFTACISPVA